MIYTATITQRRRIKAFTLLAFTLCCTRGLLFCQPERTTSAYIEASRQDHACFIENKGQWNSEAAFLMRSRNFNLWLTHQSMVYDVFTLSGTNPNHYGNVPSERTSYAVGMTFLHARQKPVLQGVRQAPGVYNYFLGKDSTQWASNVPLYEEVLYKEMYPGIDVRIYAQTGQPRYDFIVHPGAEIGAIALFYEGVQGVIGSDHELRITTGLGVMVQNGLRAYQLVDKRQVEIPCAFVVHENTVTFSLGAYDHSLPLVIDPLVYGTFVGGAQGDESYAIALDANKNTYITGTSLSTNYPVLIGAFSTTKNSLSDIVVTKLNAIGSSLSYSTFIGGSNEEYGYGIAVDASGSAYITGVSFSADYPMQNPYKSTLNGDRDIIVTKLTPGGNKLTYSTYIGGSGWDEGYGITLDGVGNAYLTGMTTSGDYPVQNPYDADANGAQDVFVTKLNGNGSALVFSTFLGGTSGDQGNAVMVDNSGNVYVGGSTSSSNFPVVTGSYDVSFNSNSNTVDGFVAKLSSNGSGLLFSTFIGGTLNDVVKSLAFDAQNNIYAAGFTESSNFPITAGAYDGSLSGIDGFISKFNNTGSSLLASTFLGGNNEDEIFDIAGDGQSVYVTGYTQSGDYPTTSTGFKQSPGGDRDAFLARFSTSLGAASLQYSTYAGGSSYDEGRSLAVDDDGNAYITGITRSDNFPITSGGADNTFNGLSDAFVIEVGTGTPTLSLLVPVNGETWCAGGKQEVAWNSRSVTYVRIELSANGGGTYPTVLADNVPAAPGRWTWNIPVGFTPGNQYKMRIVNTANSALIDAGKSNFTINSPPRVTVQPQPIIGCTGQTVQFTAVATAQPVASIQWQVSANTGATWNNILGVTTATLTLNNIQLSQNNLLYRAVFTNICAGGVASDTARLTIRTQPAILRAPANQVLCVGGPVELQVEVNEPGVSYQWRKNGVPIAGAVASKYSLQHAVATDAGNYDVVITGFCPPAVVSSIAVLSVQDAPSVSQPVFKNITCQGEVRTTTCIIRNDGPLTITVQPVSISNPHFTIISPSGDFTIPTKQERQMEIQFVPTQAGTEDGDMHFNTLPCNQELVVNVGTTVDSLRIASSDVQFEPMHQCDTLQVQKLRIENTGTTPVTITAAQFSDIQYDLVFPRTPFTVQAHKSIEASIRFQSDGSFGTFPASAVFLSNLCASLAAQSAVVVQRQEVKFQAAQDILDFGVLKRCESTATEEFMLFNLGDAPVVIDSASIDNTAFVWSAPPLPFEIKPKDNRTVRVQFVSGKSGLAKGTLKMMEKSCRVSQSIQLRGEKTGQTVAPNIATIQFRPAMSCTPRQDTTIVLTNHENDTVIVENGSIAPPFQIVSPYFPQAVAPGKSMDIIIRSAPLADGVFTGIAQFPYHTKNCQDTVKVDVRSSRATPRLAASPSRIDVMTLTACAAWKDTTLVLENTGNTELTISGIDIEPEFKILHKFPVILEPQSKDTVTLRFEPAGSYAVKGTARMHVLPCDTIVLIPVSASKQGVTYALQSSSGADTIRFTDILNCGVQQAASIIRLSVTGDGQGQSRVSRVVLASPFSTTLTSGTVLQKASQEYPVMFEPKGEGIFTTNLSVTFEPCGITKTLVLVGRKAKTVLSAQYNIVDFGKIAAGQKRTKTIVFVNTGETVAHVDSLLQTGPFSIISTLPALPALLQPGDSLFVEVEYTAGGGKETGELTASGALPCVLTAHVILRGEGVSLPVTTLSGTSLNLGPVEVGTSFMGDIVISNVGTSDALVFTLPTITGIDASMFSIVLPFADTIPVGKTAALHIRFQPVTIGLKHAVAVIEYNGKAIMIDITGEGVAPGSHTMQTFPVLPDINATPFTKGLSMPLTFSPGQNFIAAAADSFHTEIRFNSSLFLPLGVKKGVIIGDTIVDQDTIFERILTLTGRYTGSDTLLVLQGDVLLGDAMATPLKLTFAWKNKDIAAKTKDGSLTLTGVSEVGGLRLVRNKMPLNIQAITPNPSSESAHITITTIEVGMHHLQIYDGAGRKVWSRQWIVPVEERRYSSMQTFIFDSGSVAAGSYTVVLTSPTRSVSEKLIIVR